MFTRTGTLAARRCRPYSLPSPVWRVYSSTAAPEAIPARPLSRVKLAAGLAVGSILLAAVLAEPDPVLPLHPAPPSDPSVAEEHALARQTFANRSTAALLRTLLVYKYTTFPTLVSITPRLLDLAKKLRLDGVVFWVVENTAFLQFCGGVTSDDATRTLDRLNGRGIRGILDLSIEADLLGDAEDDGELDVPSAEVKRERAWLQKSIKADCIAASIAETVHAASKVPGSFVAVKCTALASDPSVLERWSLALVKARNEFECMVDGRCSVRESTPTGVSKPSSEAEFDPKQIYSHITGRTIDYAHFKELVKRYMHVALHDERRLRSLFRELDRKRQGRLDWIDYSHVFYPDNLNRYGIQLLPEENVFVTDQAKQGALGATQAEILATLARLDQLCKQAAAPLEGGCSTVQIMVDAEQSYLQPAIAYLANTVATRYNTPRAGASRTVQEPIVFDTYQLYRREGLLDLIEDVESARRDNRVWTGKLVRGAYVVQELRYAERHGTISAIWSSKKETDRAYDVGVSLAIDMATNATASAGGIPLPSGRVVIATHNHHSVDLAVARIRQLGDTSELGKRIVFAQLLGMGQLMSTKLANGGQAVAKYIPFGPVGEVVPYLVRRAEENGAVFGEDETQGKPITGSGGAEDRRGVRRVVRERLGWRRWLGLR